MAVNQLPEEILHHIFEFCSASTLGTIACVCKLWHRLSEDDHLWPSVTKRTLCINENDYPFSFPKGRRCSEEEWKYIEDSPKRRELGWKRTLLLLADKQFEHSSEKVYSGLLSWLLDWISFIVVWLISFILWPIEGVLKRPGILFLGLDNSGKTTLVHYLSTDTLNIHPPGGYSVCPVIRIGKKEVTLNDTMSFGYHYYRRTCLSEYCLKADGIVMMIDAADSERFEEAAATLKDTIMALNSVEGEGNVAPHYNGFQRLLNYLGFWSSEQQKNKKKPILILGNKIDRKEAVSRIELLKALQVHRYMLAGLNMRLNMCSIVHRVGYGDGLRWLVEQLP